MEVFLYFLTNNPNLSLKNKENGKFNLSEVQNFHNIKCYDMLMIDGEWCNRVNRNYIYALTFDIKYADLEDAKIVIGGLKKQQQELYPVSVGFEYSEVWKLMVYYGS